MTQRNYEGLILWQLNLQRLNLVTIYEVLEQSQQDIFEGLK